jgi:hypothetical protein
VVAGRESVSIEVSRRTQIVLQFNSSFGLTFHEIGLVAAISGLFCCCKFVAEISSQQRDDGHRRRVEFAALRDARDSVLEREHRKEDACFVDGHGESAC